MSETNFDRDQVIQEASQMYPTWVHGHHEAVWTTIRKWWSDPSIQRHERLGQYVYNRCAPPGSAPWPTLFYESDPAKAMTLICTAAAFKDGEP